MAASAPPTVPTLTAPAFTPSAVDVAAAMVITTWSLALLYGPTWNVSPA